MRCFPHGISVIKLNKFFQKNSMKKNLLFLMIIFVSSSCSGISGKYSEVNIGYLGMDNSVSSYDFGMFGTVKYSLSTSGSRSSNSYKSFDGNYEIDRDRVIMNFGGSDRVLILSPDKKKLTSSEGKIFEKR